MEQIIRGLQQCVFPLIEMVLPLALPTARGVTCAVQALVQMSPFLCIMVTLVLHRQTYQHWPLSLGVGKCMRLIEVRTFANGSLPVTRKYHDAGRPHRDEQRHNSLDRHVPGRTRVQLSPRRTLSSWRTRRMCPRDLHHNPNPSGRNPRSGVRSGTAEGTCALTSPQKDQ